MASRIKPTVYEALNDSADPFDAAQTMQTLANQIDRLAGKFGSTQLSGRQVMSVLGLNHIQELRQLASYGLKIYPAEGTWCIDSRDFRRWAQQTVERLGRKPRRAPAVVHQSMPELF